MRRNVAIALAAAAGAAVGALLARRAPVLDPPWAREDERAEELRRKLAEARAAEADEGDFEAAGMGAETVVEEARPPAPEAEPREPARPSPAPPEPAKEPPPADEFEAMRRRIHEEGRAAAEAMRRSADPPPS